MGADHALAGALDHQLHEGALVLVGEGELEGAEGGLVDVHGTVARARLFLGEPDRGEVRVGEHRCGDVLVIDRDRLVAEQGAGEPHRFRRGDRGEVHAVGDVADGVDRVHVGGGVLVHDDGAVGGELHARRFEAEARAVRLAAGGEQDEVGFLARAVAVGDFQIAPRAPGNRDRLTAEMDAQALRLHLFGNALAELRVEAAQQALAAVGERGLHAQAVEDRGELERNVAAADDERARRQPRKVKGLVRADGVLASRDLRQHRP